MILIIQMVKLLMDQTQIFLDQVLQHKIKCLLLTKLLMKN